MLTNACLSLSLSPTRLGFPIRNELIFTAAQVDLEDAEGLTPLMHGLLAVRSSMDSESAVRAVSVLAQHPKLKPGSLKSQQDGVGTCWDATVWIYLDIILFFFLVQLPARCTHYPTIRQDNLEAVVKRRLTSRSELIVAARDGQVRDVWSMALAWRLCGQRLPPWPRHQVLMTRHWKNWCFNLIANGFRKHSSGSFGRCCRAHWLIGFWLWDLGIHIFYIVLSKSGQTFGSCTWVLHHISWN